MLNFFQTHENTSISSKCKRFYTSLQMRYFCHLNTLQLAPGVYWSYYIMYQSTCQLELRRTDANGFLETSEPTGGLSLSTKCTHWLMTSAETYPANYHPVHSHLQHDYILTWTAYEPLILCLSCNNEVFGTHENWSEKKEMLWILTKMLQRINILSKQGGVSLTPPWSKYRHRKVHVG